MNDQVTIENLEIDGVNYLVAEQPDDIQAAVRKYEEWRERFALAQDEAALVGSALRDLGAQIVAAIRANEEAEAAAAAEAEVSEVPETPVAETPVVDGDTLVVDDA